MRPIVFLLALLPVTASADERVEALLGWTADGHHLAWQAIDDTEAYTGDGEEIREHLDWRVVLDARTGKTDRYLIDFESNQGVAVGDLALKDEWEAWSAAHPLAPAPTGPAGPQGHHAATRRCDGVPDDAWAGDRMALAPAEDANLGEVCVELGVETGGKTWWTARPEFPAAAMYTPSHWVQVAWSPDGDRTVWLLHEKGGTTMRGPVHPSTQVLVPDRSPRVEVLVPEALGSATTRRVTAALLASDAGAILEGTALKARDATVIYADETHRAHAERLAEAIPGGATVEPLTWKANGDLVVAVGSSAAP